MNPIKIKTKVFVRNNLPDKPRIFLKDGKITSKTGRPILITGMEGPVMVMPYAQGRSLMAFAFDHPSTYALFYQDRE